jgi:hypothetical protein
MVMGRPKIWTDAAIEKEADALESWSKLPNSDYLGKFCLERDYDPSYITHFCKNDYFLQTLKRVRNRIACNNRDKLHANEYNYGLFMREIGMYDSLLRANDREEKQFDSDLRKKENEIEKVIPREELLKMEDKILKLEAQISILSHNDK